MKCVISPLETDDFFIIFFFSLGHKNFHCIHVFYSKEHIASQKQELPILKVRVLSPGYKLLTLQSISAAFIFVFLNPVFFNDAYNENL